VKLPPCSCSGVGWTSPEDENEYGGKVHSTNPCPTCERCWSERVLEDADVAVSMPYKVYPVRRPSMKHCMRTKTHNPATNDVYSGEGWRLWPLALGYISSCHGMSFRRSSWSGKCYRRLCCFRSQTSINRVAAASAAATSGSAPVLTPMHACRSALASRYQLSRRREP
jgi:hypothetical protein